ncbi:MAG TPA: hypothetical protein VFZ78_13670, partial [Flavisolibacter sp.]
HTFANESRVSLFRNEVNRGRVGNYQRLFHELGAGADWILNLDGDDHYTDRHFITRALDAIHANGGAGEIVLYHYQFDITPLKDKGMKLGEHAVLTDGAEYVIQRPLVRSFYHLGAMVNRKAAEGSGFYSYPSLNTDALSIQEVALRGKVIVDDRQIGEWSLKANSETRRSFSELEKERYEIANRSFLQILKASLSDDQMGRYLGNLGITEAKEEIVSLLRGRQFSRALRSLRKHPLAFRHFGREIIKVALGVD